MSDISAPEFSQTLGSLAKALAAAQGELENASRDGINPFFSKDGKTSKYATLASVRGAITPVLSKHGLSVVQYNEPHGVEGVCVVTLLLHESGEWIKGRLFVPVSKKDAQGFGSALSYARRYALAAIANIATDDDDDATEAVKPGKAPAPPESKPAPPAAKSDVDVEALVKALEDAKDTKELSAASLAVGRVKDKVTPAVLERCRAAHDNTLRRLEKAA